MTDHPNTVECEVTGKTIPRDDAVLFQGKWVGAEGKAILLERLRSGADGSDLFQAVSVSQRFIGIFIDSVIFSVLYFVVILSLTYLNRNSSSTPRDPEFVIPGMVYLSELKTRLIEIVVQIGTLVLFAAYLTRLHFRNGQTFRKIIARTKVIRVDGAPLSIRRSFLRAVSFLGFNLFACVVGIFVICFQFVFVNATFSDDPPLDTISTQLPNLTIIATASSVMAWVYLIANMLVASFSRHGRSIHDRLSGTRVIKDLS